MTAWLSAFEHREAVLVISALGCIMFMGLNMFWWRLLFATTLALKHYGLRIEALEYDLGIEGHLARGQVIPRDSPPVGIRSLYAVLFACIVAWGVLAELILLPLGG
ncbi:hypothetical protein A3A38_02310 [Candidatus Kaiserbacteria bacterium RIFCSPLOWO2_01_FULL_53_17]|uniref:Uncharacterized protein n=1 Tax=Candidatus Kaiserbacteria bacterium RIFCSPLOWO2_01_FULL_53_17 TaxID=1798511 RepID=A0A1F6EFZ5_9BACT|nr:MAG: hypothetical protein A3A38_02310 [Candidatus Kaiserbacteria bacterium RIFCSPLOWO2_01_FULL_53_17]